MGKIDYIEANSLEWKAIPDLKGYNFYIPDYQRGYRWEKDQIQQLLSDLYDFFYVKESGNIYCLQPVIVKQLTSDDIKNRLTPEVYAKYKDYLDLDNKIWYEVADGQQRLTTIKLILLFGALTRRGTSDQHYNLFYAFVLIHVSVRKQLPFGKPFSDILMNYSVSAAVLPAILPNVKESPRPEPSTRNVPWKPPVTSPAAYRPSMMFPSVSSTCVSSSISTPPMK